MSRPEKNIVDSFTMRWLQRVIDFAKQEQKDCTSLL